jgi:hypothetical protein
MLGIREREVRFGVRMLVINAISNRFVLPSPCAFA